MLNFGAESALVSYFCARILKKLLPYLKSAPLKLSNCKILQKNKKFLNLGPKMPYLGIFWLEFFYKIYI